MYALQDQLSAAMAEKVGLVKELLVRAEDARNIEQTLVVLNFILIKLSQFLALLFFFVDYLVQKMSTILTSVFFFFCCFLQFCAEQN